MTVTVMAKRKELLTMVMIKILVSQSIGQAGLMASFLASQIDQMGTISDSIARGVAAVNWGKKSLAWLMGCYFLLC